MIGKKTYTIDFSKNERNIRKAIAILLKVLVILGYIFYASYSVLIFWSASEIRVNPKDFSEVNIDNETIYLKGIIEIDNDHWASMDITDLNISITFFLTNGTALVDYKLEIDRIPAREKTDIEIEIPIAFDSVIFYLLNNTSELELDLDLEISFWYGLYGISIWVETTLEAV